MRARACRLVKNWRNLAGDVTGLLLAIFTPFHRAAGAHNEIYCMSSIVFGGINMNQTFTAIAKNDGEWWIGWIVEVPGVNCQERSRDELLKTLRVTLMEALEMNGADARDAGGNDYEELSIVV